MKTVFSNEMVAHVWAQQRQPFGRSNSMHFDGAVLLSYQTPIACIATDRHGGKVALFTTEKHSMTTSSKHMPAATRAWSGPSFHVKDIGAQGGRVNSLIAGPRSDAKSWAQVHKLNATWLHNDYLNMVAKFLRVQSWYWRSVDDVRRYLQDAADILHRYCDRFGVTPYTIHVYDDAARVWARCVLLEERRADPKWQAKRDADRQAREDRAERKREREAAERAERNRVALADWRAGLPVVARHLTDEQGGALLRVRGNVVQTSLGAEAPRDHVLRVLRFVDKLRKAGHVEFERPEVFNRPDVTLGHFTLDRIDARGVRAGCHFIAWAEVERLRTALSA